MRAVLFVMEFGRFASEDYARTMKSWRVRLVISVVVALFLPLPNPHVDEYVPLIQAATHDPNFDSLAFWVILALVWGVYSAVVFAVLSIIRRLSSRMVK